jgi:gas vesicle protein
MSEVEEKPQVSQEFINNVKKYIEIDDFIKENKNKLKKYVKEKKEKEEYILNYLSTIKEDVIDLQNGRLKRNISKTQEPLKKEIIHKALTELIGDKASQFTEHIIKSRGMKERITLKRTKNKS